MSIKTLYRYSSVLTDNRVEKYKLQIGDPLQKEMEVDGRIVWRVWNRETGVDFSGYAKRKEAKAEYLENIRTEIYRLQEILKLG